RIRPRSGRGLTLVETLIAMFIFLIGIVGVLAAMPTGVNSAIWVIFQDAAIHLAHSKFAEFRRDRVDPAVDLVASGSGYLPNSAGPGVPGAQEGFNNEGDPWRDFAHSPGDTYQYFDDIWKYEWKIEVSDVDAGSGTSPVAPAGSY